MVSNPMWWMVSFLASSFVGVWDIMHRNRFVQDKACACTINLLITAGSVPASLSRVESLDRSMQLHHKGLLAYMLTRLVNMGGKRGNCREKWGMQ